MRQHRLRTSLMVLSPCVVVLLSSPPALAGCISGNTPTQNGQLLSSSSCQAVGYGPGGTAVGTGAVADNYATAVGDRAFTAPYGVSIGWQAGALGLGPNGGAASVVIGAWAS